MGTAVLRLDDIVARRGDFRLEADLALAPGACLSVMGPSGSGKSSLLDVLGGFLAPTSGRLLWHGRDITALAPGDRPVAMLFQDNNLFPHLDVAANVALGLRLRGRLTTDERGRIAAALDRVGLAGYGARRPADLSGGQRSRVALARLAVQSRPVIAVDEPFAALGPGLKADMIDLTRDMAAERGATVLMVTHDPGDARRLGGMLSVVVDGTVTPPAPVADVLDDPPPALRCYLGSASDVPGTGAAASAPQRDGKA